jgi:ATP-binding cassette, subfamily B, bacterial
MEATVTGSESAFARMRKTLPFLTPYRFSIAAVSAMTLMVAALDALEPLLMKYLFDSLGMDNAGRAFGLSVAGLASLAVMRRLLGGFLNWIFWRIRIGVNNSIQHAVVDRLCTLPLAFFRSRSVGSIITKMNRGIGGYMDVFSELTTRVLPNVIYLIISLVSMYLLDWRLFLVALMFCPLPTLIGAWAAKEQTERENTLMTRWSHIFGRFHEVLSGIATVKSFTREAAERGQFMAHVRETNRVVLRGVTRDTSVDAVSNLIIALGRITIAAAGGYLVIKGQATVGTVVAFLGYIGGLFGPVQGLTGTYQMLRRASVFLNAIFEILEAVNPLKDAPDARLLKAVRGAVEFENVTFAYENGPLVLKNITLRVRPGETLALVGPSGAGKSTFLSLLQRFEDPVSGRIAIDGVPLRAIQRESLCRHVAFVMQDTMLFNESIHFNIAYGRPEATPAQIEAAARAANAHDFITALPHAYATVVGEGGKCLSTGQRQRIAIARALLKDAPILILDEATSALDAESELLVQQALRQLIRGRTTFIIAHRLQTVAAADRIIVLKEGRIIEQGTHQELIHTDSYYASLVRKQTSGLIIPERLAA